MLLLPLLSQEFTYRSRTKHNLLDISSHLNLSFSLSVYLIYNLSVYISACRSTDSWCYRPSSNPDSAGWCGCCKRTHSSLTDWSLVFCFFGFGGGTILKSFFSHLTFRKVRNTARTLRTSKSTTSPCVIYISPLRLSKIIWLGHEGQLRMATWSWLVEF